MTEATENVGAVGLDGHAGGLAEPQRAPSTQSGLLPLGGVPWVERAWWMLVGVLRVDWTPDRVGVEVGGSLKNVLAIACGILDGLGSGANTKAALIIQGIQEMAAIVRALGGKPETIYGVAGLGDLVLSGTSLESRNRALGEKLAGGRRVSQARREIPTIVEGIEAVKSARRLARSLKLKLPLLSAIWDVVHGGKRPERVLASLGFKDINHG